MSNDDGGVIGICMVACDVDGANEDDEDDDDESDDDDDEEDEPEANEVFGFATLITTVLEFVLI